MLQISRGMTKLSQLVAVLTLLCVVKTHLVLAIRIQRDFNYPVVPSFDVFWNVPTYMCQRYNIDFEPELKKYGITVNNKDSFRGEKIVILYDPGLFPAMLEDTSTGTLKERNGGIPQLGDINEHLKEFGNVMEKMVSKDFSGIGIIDFEAWRPVWRQNWNDQVIYRNMTVKLEKQRHPGLSDVKINAHAKNSFEAASKEFMERTLELAKSLRPNAKWGYYGFPYCYNSGVGQTEDCPDLAKRENNDIYWLFASSTAFYPSVYVNHKISPDEVKSLVIGRLNEAWKISIKVSSTNPPPVHPYVALRHTSDDSFLSEEKMFNTLDTTRQYKMGGAIIWGSSGHLRSEGECRQLYDYLQKVLGPVVLRVQSNNKRVKNIKFRGYIRSNAGIYRSTH